MGKIKGWKKTVDNVRSNDFNTLLTAWSTPNDIVIQIRRVMGSSFYFIERVTESSGITIATTNTFEEAREKAINYMRMHPNG